MGAGMTIRSTFQKIAAEYEGNPADKRGLHPAYEEILYTCRELQSGVSEPAAYEHFGIRTGIQEYIRFCTLLQQNLKKGSSTLLERLREEADKAAQEKLLNSRRLGEEASTRLLVPMIMMLLVVMLIIIVPAFSSASI
jgi:pilus assembly protein TadC